MSSQKLTYHTKTSTISNQIKISARRKRSRHQVPPLSKKLLATDTCQEGENQFSPTEHHWVYQPHSRVGPTHRHIWSTQEGLHFVCVCTFLFCYFFVLLCFYLFSFLFLLLLFFGEREHEIGWVGIYGENLCM